MGFPYHRLQLPQSSRVCRRANMIGRSFNVTRQYISVSVMDLFPTAIDRNSTASIVIKWSDGATLQYLAGDLRSKCPCATCREKKSAETNKKPLSLPVLSLAEAQPLRIEGMRPVGNYAYNILFSDGHDSGIFTMDFLREVGIAVAQ